jgi:hypothetical protein
MAKEMQSGNFAMSSLKVSFTQCSESEFIVLIRILIRTLPSTSKNFRKSLISTVLQLFNDLFPVRTDVNVPSE